MFLILLCTIFLFFPLYCSEISIPKMTFSKSSLLDEPLKSAVDNICKREKDAYRALIEVEEFLERINCKGTPEFFQKLSTIESFEQHIRTIVIKIGTCLDEITPSFFEYFLRFIYESILAKLSPNMQLLIKEIVFHRLLKGRFEYSSPAQISCKEIAKPAKMHFVSSKVLIVGFDPYRRSHNGQKVIKITLGDRQNSKNSSWLGTSQAHDFYAAHASPSNHERVIFKYNNKEMIKYSLSFYKDGSPEVQRGIYLRTSTSQLLEKHVIPYLRNGYSQVEYFFKISHNARKIVYVFVGCYSGNKIDLKACIADVGNNVDIINDDIRNRREQNARDFFKTTILGNSLPTVSIKFSHQDLFVCLILPNVECWLIDLQNNSKLLVDRFLTAATFMHDDSRLIVAKTNQGKQELSSFYLDVKPDGLHHTYYGSITLADTQVVTALKFSPNDGFLCALQGDNISILYNVNGICSLECNLFAEALLNCVRLLRKYNLAQKKYSALMRIRGSATLNQLAYVKSKHDETLAIPAQYDSTTDNLLHLSEQLLHLPTKNTKWCLAINGEYMDALICVAMLHKIEQHTGYPIYKVFDCIVGTSAASLVALTIAASEDGEAPYSSTKKLINFFYKIAKFTATSQTPAKRRELFCRFLIELVGRTKLSNCLTRVIVPYVEEIVKSGAQAKLCYFDRQEAQTYEKKDFVIEDAIKDSIGDNTLIAANVIEEQNNQKQRRASSSYKNNASAFLYETLCAHSSAENIYVVSLSTGITNDSNIATHEFLKNKMGLYYKFMRPSSVPQNGDYSASALDAYAKMGEEAVTIGRDIVESLKRSYAEKLAANQS